MDNIGNQYKEEDNHGTDSDIQNIHVINIRQRENMTDNLEH